MPDNSARDKSARSEDKSVRKRALVGPDARQLGPRTTRTETSRPVSEDKSARSEDKSARKRGLVGPYEKTTRTVNNYSCLSFFFLIKLTEIIKIVHRALSLST